jgi:hypothetical protein
MIFRQRVLCTLKTKICEGCEGSEASTQGTYQFGKHKNTNSRGEIDENLMNSNQIQGKVLPKKPSHLSQARTETYIKCC